jgi:hypothetical protein
VGADLGPGLRLSAPTSAFYSLTLPIAVGSPVTPSAWQMPCAGRERSFIVPDLRESAMQASNSPVDAGVQMSRHWDVLGSTLYDSGS